MRFSTVVATILALSTPVICRAQTTAAQLDEVRRQMETLQKQLAAFQTAESPQGKVTQLGSGSRYRSGAPNLVVRVYDLSDLFAIAPSYTATVGNDLGLTSRPLFPEALSAESGSGLSGSGGLGGMGMGGGGGFGGAFGDGMFSVSSRTALQTAATMAAESAMADVAASAKSSISQVINAITDTISPDSWQSVGGESTIAQLGTSLIISTEPVLHEQIDGLFRVLRQRWGTLRTVSLNAWWLRLNEQQLSELLPGDGKNEVGINGLRAWGVVDDLVWNRLLAALADEKSGRPFLRAAVTCHNGQTVSVVAGAEEGSVSTMDPVAATRIGYKPTVVSVHEGTALQITPLVNASGRFVMLDVHSRVALREPAPPREALAGRGRESPPTAVVAALDRTRLTTQRLATTLRVPVDRVTLIGGINFTGKPVSGEPALFLFLRATVQELRDDTPASGLESQAR